MLLKPPCSNLLSKGVLVCRLPNSNRLFPLAQNPVVPLIQKLNALKVSLTAETLVKNWDYEGVAPDSEFPLVGSVWPISLQPGTVGRGSVTEFLCVAALWADTQVNLLQNISVFTESISNVYGSQTANCPSDLASVASLVTLGPLTIGAPSYSAPSSIGDVRGVWASVQFPLSIR